VYRFKIQLEQDQRTITPGDVEIRLDIEDGVPITAMRSLEENAGQFEQMGFTVTGNNSFGIVCDYWEEVNPTALERTEFLDEVANRFAELVRVSHSVLTENA
jgi:hypothetical protein